MASNVVVIDSSFRRHTVKVTPGKYMTEVLEEACKKFNFKAENYGLKNKDKPIDLSRTFRQTGLVSGAKLELVQASRTPSAVSVALQLPEAIASTVPGGRLVGKVPSDTTLWRILRHLESKEGLNLNFTARGAAQIENRGASGAGRIFYEMPALNIMGRECSSFGDLQKTLAQLGINGGSTLIRLSFKQTEQPLEEAIAEIRQYFKEEEAPAEPTTPKDVDTITNALDKSPEPESKDVDMISGISETSTTEPDPSPYPETADDLPPSQHAITQPPPEQVLGPGQRPISVYRPPTNEVPLAATKPHNESDYEPTIAHAKLHQSRLKTNSENKRLPSDAEAERLEAEKAAKKLTTAKEVSIKIRFPDQSSIIAPFTASDTGSHLHTFVRGVIVAEDQPFKLVWNGKGVQTVPNNDKKLIKDLGFERSVLVNFHWEDDARGSVRSQTILKKEYVQTAREVSVPEVPSVEAREEDSTPVVKEGSGGNSSGSGEGTGKKGVPKWLNGFGKK